jgi:hypothetical protein
MEVTNTSGARMLCPIEPIPDWYNELMGFLGEEPHSPIVLEMRRVILDPFEVDVRGEVDE